MSTDPDALDLRTALYLFWPGLVGLRQINAWLSYLQFLSTDPRTYYVHRGLY
jgi:hypothetical protein